MQPIQLFALASRQAEWLSVRQEVVATNIANANTPEFRAKDITPFHSVLNETQASMTRTHPGHLAESQYSQTIGVNENDLDNEIGIQESGNTVALADELSKTGEIKRQYELSAGLVKSFHSMMLMTVRR
ncbi:flagellar basal body rod protein FlgB [Neorhizobium sp. T786]|uniref:flagellar basal body rod protein FlgB n=1 Tax=Pseudorhizobium xiangyangii TaxID=2883104 RepID=UPI001CFF887A|nr:flagellar basal body rod protein FlgB [Neorhizobium xiangyangii]MCB5202645.1 flagellar basal body rod protein FlgB [Neorhizobium xiangyangii]